MHGSHSSEDEPMGEMNLIPLIDIALTLLIIMMVTTAFVRHPGVSLKLPETVTREGAPEMSKDQTVAITSDGSLFMDGRKLTDAEVQARMRTVAQVNKDARILIKGDRDVVYRRVMEVMDLIRQAGLTKVVLPTDPKIGQPTSAASSSPVPASSTATPSMSETVSPGTSGASSDAPSVPTSGG